MSTARPRYIMTGVLLLLLFNYPLLSSVNKPLFIGEVPLLYAYIGTVWLLAIILLFLTSRHYSKPRK